MERRHCAKKKKKKMLRKIVLWLMNNCPRKSKTLKSQVPLRFLLLLSFLFKIVIRSSCSKILQNFVGNVEIRVWISVLVPWHRPSYLWKLNCGICCPSNFEAVISRNICYWLLHLFCFIHYHSPNWYRFITWCSAFATMQHILRTICWQ